jgi:Eukaryotic mitochondrial regulator protein
MQPFPLNPSFKPPTPVSDKLKSHIYDLYMANPTTNGVRSIAARYGMSIKRVDAILRLKGLEKDWEKVRDFFD